MSESRSPRPSRAPQRDLFEVAKDLWRAHDYEQAISLLESIQPAARSESAERLLERCRERSDESRFLREEIQNALSTGRFRGLRENLDRLLEIQPGAKRYREMREALDTYRTGEYRIRTLDDGTRTIDPAGPTVTAGAVVLFVLFLLMLSGGAYVAWYHVLAKDLVTPRFSETEEDPGLGGKGGPLPAGLPLPDPGGNPAREGGPPGTAGGPGAIVDWGTVSRRIPYPFPTPNPVFSSDGNVLAAVIMRPPRSAGFMVWDGRTYALRHDGPVDGAVSSIVVSPDGERALMYGSGKPAFFVSTSDQAAPVVPLEDFSPTPPSFEAVWSSDGTLYAKAETPARTGVFRIEPATGRAADFVPGLVARLAVSADGRRLALLTGRLGDPNQQVEVRRLPEGEVEYRVPLALEAPYGSGVSRIFVPDDGGSVLCLANGPPGGMHLHVVRRDGNAVRHHLTHRTGVHFALAADGTWIAGPAYAGGTPGTGEVLAFWETETGREMQRSPVLGERINGFALAADQTRLVVVVADTTAKTATLTEYRLVRPQP